MKAAVFLWILALVVDIFMDKSRPEIMWLLVISLFLANTIAIIEYIKMGKLKKNKTNALKDLLILQRVCLFLYPK